MVKRTCHFSLEVLEFQVLPAEAAMPVAVPSATRAWTSQTSLPCPTRPSSELVGGGAVQI